MMKAGSLAIGLVTAWGTLGCGRLGDVLALQRTRVHEFHTDAISVDVRNRSVLTVLSTSSDATMLAGPDRRSFARRVAESVRDHYRAYGGLSRVDVGFGQGSGAGPGDLRTAAVSYSYTPVELGAPRDTTEGTTQPPAARGGR